MVENTVDIMSIVKAGQVSLIYGAGVYGRKIYQLLTICKLGHKVACFVVSDGATRVDNTMGIPVITFENAEQQYPEAAILVAVKGAEELFERVKRIHKGAVYFCQKEELCILCHNMFIKLWDYPIKNNKLFFQSNYGQGYMCNGKYITEELIRQNQDVDIVWAVRNMGAEVPAPVRKVEVDSPEYYYEMATSKIWIDNCRKDIYTHKRKNQYYIQTWHGSGPLKKVEKDIENTLNLEYIRSAKNDGEMIDLFLSSSSANSNMYRNSFYSHGDILECGSPRNDLMFNSRSVDKDKIRHSLGVENRNARIVLYAPTFRRTIENSVRAYDLEAKRVKKELEKKFGGSFVMLVRFHSNLCGNEQLAALYSDCIHVTDYADVQELLIISDVLITDYSSILWDFSLQKKPVFLYQNDEQENLDDRGFYSPLCEWPYPRAHNLENLYRKIAEFEEEEYISDLERFFQKWTSFDDGHASARAVERIMDVIHNPQKYMKSR